MNRIIFYSRYKARECDQLVDLTKQTVAECKTELEKLRNSDQKENQPNDKEIFNFSHHLLIFLQQRILFEIF